MVNNKEIAELAGVSGMSVSNVINNRGGVSEETRRKIVKVIEEMNYIPNESARRLKSAQTRKSVMSKTFNIGLITYNCVLNTPALLYDYRRVLGISNEVTEHGYHLDFNYMVKQLESNLGLFLRLVSMENIDGLIMLGMGKPEADFMAKVRNRIKAIVYMDCREIEDADQVSSDKENAGYSAVKYLFGLGHRRIGYIGIESHIDKKYTGFCNGLNEFNLEYDRSLMGGSSETNPFRVELGFESMDRILNTAKTPPTAVFAASDKLAFGAINAIKARGLKVPEDISVIGFDDIEEAGSFSPALTTFRVEQETLGAAAVKRLIERIDDPALPPVNMVFPTKFIKRESCSATRQKA